MKGREQGGKRVKEGGSPANHLEVTPNKVCLFCREVVSGVCGLISNLNTRVRLQ